MESKHRIPRYYHSFVFECVRNGQGEKLPLKKSKYRSTTSGISCSQCRELVRRMPWLRLNEVIMAPDLRMRQPWRRALVAMLV